MSSEAPGGRGGRGGGRRKGRGGGRGRGEQGNSNTGPNKQQQPKTNRQKRRGGGGRGSPKPEPMTEEEKKAVEEQKRAAEEAARLEEERKRKQEAEKAAEAAKQALVQRQIDLCKQVNEACDTLSTTVQITLQHKESRAVFAAESLVKSRKDFEASKKSLKSDLKKCTALVKKIKSGGAWSLRPAEITRDVAALNLSRYVDEVASALTESKLKVADLPVVVALCSAMHQRYAEFLPALLPSLWSTIHGKVTEETAKLRRLYLRLITEFLLNGIIFETKPLLKTIADATGGSDGSYVVTDANLVMSFVKAAGFEVLGTIPRSIQDSIDLLQREVERAQQAVANSVEDAAVTEPSTVIDAELAEKARMTVAQMEGVLAERAVSPQVTEVLATHCMEAYRFLAHLLDCYAHQAAKVGKTMRTRSSSVGNAHRDSRKGVE